MSTPPSSPGPRSQSASSASSMPHLSLGASVHSPTHRAERAAGRTLALQANLQSPPSSPRNPPLTPVSPVSRPVSPLPMQEPSFQFDEIPPAPNVMYLGSGNVRSLVTVSADLDTAIENAKACLIAKKSLLEGAKIQFALRKAIAYCLLPDGTREQHPLTSQEVQKMRDLVGIGDFTLVGAYPEYRDADIDVGSFSGRDPLSGMEKSLCRGDTREQRFRDFQENHLPKILNTLHDRHLAKAKAEQPDLPEAEIRRIRQRFDIYKSMVEKRLEDEKARIEDLENRVTCQIEALTDRKEDLVQQQQQGNDPQIDEEVRQITKEIESLKGLKAKLENFDVFAFSWAHTYKIVQGPLSGSPDAQEREAVARAKEAEEDLWDFMTQQDGRHKKWLGFRTRDTEEARYQLTQEERDYAFNVGQMLLLTRDHHAAYSQERRLDEAPFKDSLEGLLFRICVDSGKNDNRRESSHLGLQSYLDTATLPSSQEMIENLKGILFADRNASSSSSSSSDSDDDNDSI